MQISRGDWLAGLTGAGLLSVLISRASAKPAPPDKKPNILFIMSDDHTAQAIGAYGSRLAPLNPTPTIDTK